MLVTCTGYVLLVLDMYFWVLGIGYCICDIVNGPYLPALHLGERRGYLKSLRHHYVITSALQGTEGFRNTRKGTTFAAQTAATAAAKVEGITAPVNNCGFRICLDKGIH